MGKLTTHVLDTALGQPGRDIVVELFHLQNGERKQSSSTRTNDDGRVSPALLQGAEFKQGTYELDFHAGDYLQRAHLHLVEPLFLDVITIRFTVADADQHYHVPLLLSPFAYSTYRGS
jgi:5-hydroxyisourate hydrolase